MSRSPACAIVRSMPARAETVSLGFRVHTGWAVAVALTGPDPTPRLVDRRRVELRDPLGSVPVQAYHAARELGPEQGAAMVNRALEIAASAAERAVVEIVTELAPAHHVGAGVVLLGAARVPTAIESVLASHVLCHAAEAALYRKAIMTALDGCGVMATGVPERAIWDRAGEALRVGADVARGRVGQLARGLGPPWGQDQKLAAAAALVGLKPTDDTAD